MPDRALENYASPHLRLGIFYDDHPDGQMTPGIATTAELGLSDRLGGADGLVAFVHLEWTGGRKHHKVTGTKPVPSGRVDAEALTKLGTNALGRALKAAGYPANTVDLRALMHWRQRTAEVAAIAEGLTLGQAGRGTTEADAALEAAGKPTEDHDEPDEEASEETREASGEAAPTTAAEHRPRAEATPADDPEVIQRRRELGERAEALGLADPARKFLSDRYGQITLAGLDGRQLGTFKAWLDAAEKRAAVDRERAAKAPGAQDRPPVAGESRSPGSEEGGSPNGANEGGQGPRSSPSVPEGPPEIREALEAYMGLPKRWREDVDARMAQTGVSWDTLTADQATQLLDDVIPAARQF